MATTQTTITVDAMPTLPVHALSPIHAERPITPPEQIDGQDSRPELSRSASFQYLSGQSQDATQGISRSFSENVLSVTSPSRNNTPADEMRLNRELFRRASRKTKKRMSGMFHISTDDDMDKENIADNTDPQKNHKTVSSTFRSLARKSWIPSRSPSRSSSPTTSEPKLEKSRSWSPAKKAAQQAANNITVPKAVVSRSPSPHGDKQLSLDMPSRKRLSKLDQSLNNLRTKNRSESSLKRLSTRSSTSSLRISSNGGPTPDDNVPPLPKSMSSDRLSTLNAEFARRKDPLLTAFRAIEGEYAIFQSKPSLQKAKVLRASLLPFLAKYADDTSASTLRAEDLDRRVNILNKWWVGLLEMLDGTHNQCMTGTDRPTYLDAAAQLMMRSEWKTPGFPPVATDQPPATLPTSKSTTSTKSEDSDFLTETIHQNVRNLFVQNLLSQLAFVVEKLGQRSTPASLVNFAGKTCAYAFCYCPGTAEFLVRLWRITPATLRRTFDAAGINRRDKLDLVSSALAGRFPAPLRALKVGSQAVLARSLQISWMPPPGTESIPWFGAWMSRWAGRDSDLFFVFAKHYHILIAEFLQGEEISARDCMAVPGYVLVHAQILTILDITINRSSGHSQIEDYTAPINEAMGNYEAVAAMPMTIANAARSINENRLVILLRDILGDRTTEGSAARDLYTRSFVHDLKAATVAISVHDNEGCIVLCDMIEEVLPIISRSYPIENSLHEWSFWLDVCKKMMRTEATLTQIRVITFVYSTWTILITNEQRKREWVLDWILEPLFFEKYFCHWSAMVRHYFLRFLCWRVGRCDHEPSLLDLEILRTLATRLDKCWAHHQYICAESEMRALCPPSTAPASPAPNRQLLIIRTDSQPSSHSAFASFDRFMSPGLLNQSSPYERSSSVLNTIPNADSSKVDNSKKRFSWLGKLALLSGAPGNDRPGEVTPPQTPGEDGRQLEHQEPKPISRPVTPPHQAFSFKFSLEWVDLGASARNPNRKLYRPMIPASVQQLIQGARTSNDSNGSNKSLKSAEVKPLKPVGRALETAPYAGRALAEWSLVINENRSFFLRRKQEGVPRDSLVEVPVMTVENFKLSG